MRQSGPPTEPTGFAKLLGVNFLGTFIEEENKYVVEVDGLNPQAINFFKTLHGGAVLGLCDDFLGMLIYHKYGVNSAVTIDVNTNIQYLAPVRPTSKLRFVCGMSPDVNGVLFLYVMVTSDDKQVAHMTATWHRR